MSKSRLLRKLRQHDYYKPMLAALHAGGIEDYQILSPTGRGHAILFFWIGERDVRIPLPTTPSGPRSVDMIVTQIRRAVRTGSSR